MKGLLLALLVACLLMFTMAQEQYGVGDEIGSRVKRQWYGHHHHGYGRWGRGYWGYNGYGGWGNRYYW